MAAAKNIPARLPVRRDALGAVRRNCEDMLTVCEEWESLITSTDLNNGGQAEGGIL